MNIDMMDFLTDEQVEQIQKEIVDKMIKQIQETDIDMGSILQAESESIIECVFQDCDMSAVEFLVSDFLVKTLKKALK